MSEARLSRSTAAHSRPRAAPRVRRASYADGRARDARSLDVVCFGEILWDIFGVATRGAPPAPIARDLRRELGGAPANVATGLARLGVRAGIVGGIGIDKLG